MAISSENIYLTDFQRAYGKPEVNAAYKVVPADFQVIEDLGFELSGEGEHVCIFVEKTGLNTIDITNQLARIYGLPKRDISYAGIKDRQAQTRQWFSLRVGLKRELDFSQIQSAQINVLEVSRNSRKIKRGSHKGNRFIIRLQNLEGNISSLFSKVELILSRGVPNYFGQQRFGRNRDNVNQALKYFSGQLRVKDKFLRGIYISAARSWLFNTLLAERVENGQWDNYIDGDVMSLEGSASCFVPEQWDDELSRRIASLDIHPSGPLWGKGSLRSTSQTKSLEQELRKNYPDLCDGLEERSLKQERRALRLFVPGIKFTVEDDTTGLISFSLVKGAYATSVLREFVTIINE